MIGKTRIGRVTFVAIFLISGIFAVFIARYYFIHNDLSSIEIDNSKLEVFFKEEITDYGFVTRTYHINSATIVAQSFGYEINDYYKVDEYGLPEFFCNCVYGGDGHRELYVYKFQDDMVMQGTVDYEKLDLPDFDYWGANALQTEYDPETDSIKVYYSTDFHEELKVTYADFDMLHFILWNSTSATSIYTEGGTA